MTATHRGSITLYFLFFAFLSSAQTVDYTKYADPFIGTGGHGHTFPGATTPFGMVQLSPDTRDDGSWDGCSGYHYSDSMMYGFTHTHLSGTGCSDYGDILLMPVPDTITLQRKFSAAFRHKNEKAEPGFYSVKLDNGISADLTASARCGIHKYTFPQGMNPAILLDLVHRDQVTEAYLKIVDKSTVEGFRRSKAWARDQVVYFRIEFSKPYLDYKMVSDSMKKDNIRFHNEYFGKIKSLFRFDLKPGESISAKVSISGVDIEGAGKNMTAEIPAWDFEKVKADAHAAWNGELSKIEVSGGTDEQMKIFYTALYHCFIQPNIYNDVDGRYRGRDFKIHTADGFNYYTVFSLWDTFRAYHPLMTIIDRKRTLDFIRTFLAEYEQGGLLPVWELSSNETECMIGYHSVSVIADAAVKGITGFDMEKALLAMKKSAESRDRYGIGSYMDKGMIETDDEGENVSRTLEYAYDDWCIAQVASLLKKEQDSKTYFERAQSWKNLFDPATGFIRPRKNGGWYEPFDAREVNNNYTEANAWQYTFFVPQDVQGLISFSNGSDGFEKKLDELFSSASETTGREQSDITGLIGQYAHGNEPSHHMAYLYNYIGKPWKTQEKVHQVLTEFYHAAPDGLIGNEDCGQMSAWYVLSALGIYQVCPGNERYQLSAPLFPKAKIHLENGKFFTISSAGAYKPNQFFHSTGSKKEVRMEIGYAEIMKGGELKMEASPATDRIPVPGSPGLTASTSIMPDPVIEPAVKSFKSSLAVSMKANENASVYYTTNGSVPSASSTLYSAPVTFDSSCTVKAIAIDSKGKSSRVVTSRLLKMPHPDWTIELNSLFDQQYTGGGEEALIDGLRGDVNWRKGYWQGFQGKDFECVIDMGKEQKVGSFSARFLQDAGAWIILPVKVEFSFSKDGINFSGTTGLTNNIKDVDEKVQVKEFRTSLIKPVDARFVKIKAVSSGKLPASHPGAGYDSWLFADEITIN